MQTKGWKRFLPDVRELILVVPATLVLMTDMPVFLTLLYALSAILLVVALSHFVRKVLYPYVDLEVVTQKAQETPTGAALVFIGISLVVGCVVLGAALWIAS